ncbi:AbrB/MazE/SpoVT family DNA-binding domain-containing protein [Anaerolineales bacterium HSG25]|nr:AbrB/MazE/SpoVT family DNA-binding domain-containing protein [Anaerolineales bacterium HSG25]
MSHKTEKVYQSIGTEGLTIPITLMRQYGFEQGASVVLEFHPDGIRIVPARPEQETIENLALRYLLFHVGDGATVKVKVLPNDAGWQAEVYGLGMTEASGTLIYSLAGILLDKKSTSPAKIRQNMLEMVNAL